MAASQRVIDPVVLHPFRICATASLPTPYAAAPILQTTVIAAVRRPDLWLLRAADTPITENKIKVQPDHKGQKPRA